MCSVHPMHVGELFVPWFSGILARYPIFYTGSMSVISFVNCFAIFLTGSSVRSVDPMHVL